MKKLFLLLFAACVTAVGYSQQVKTEPHATIYVESNTIDYGVIKKGSDGKRTYKVYNKGQSPLIVSNCSVSCQCTAPDCPREPILPGKFAIFSVGYNTQLIGNFTKTFSIMSNDPNQPGLTITIRGEVKE